MSHHDHEKQLHSLVGVETPSQGTRWVEAWTSSFCSMAAVTILVDIIHKLRLPAPVIDPGSLHALVLLVLAYLA
ncbi:hypothetical protein FRC16_006178, partial [Serendipita sp. 398]